MSMTDPIADLLTRIRNAQTAKHATLDVPASRMKAQIVKTLKDEGFIDDFALREDPVRGTITITLRYESDGTPGITGLEKVTRAGRRVYRGKREIPKVLNGLGITIVSTSRGVMTGAQCARHGVGGEILCVIW